MNKPFVLITATLSLWLMAMVMWGVTTDNQPAMAQTATHAARELLKPTRLPRTSSHREAIDILKAAAAPVQHVNTSIPNTGK